MDANYGRPRDLGPTGAKNSRLRGMVACVYCITGATHLEHARDSESGVRAEGRKTKGDRKRELICDRNRFSELEGECDLPDWENSRRKYINKPSPTCITPASAAPGSRSSSIRPITELRPLIRKRVSYPVSSSIHISEMAPKKAAATASKKGASSHPAYKGKLSSPSQMPLP